MTGRKFGHRVGLAFGGNDPAASKSLKIENDDHPYVTHSGPMPTPMTGQIDDRTYDHPAYDHRYDHFDQSQDHWYDRSAPIKRDNLRQASKK